MLIINIIGSIVSYYFTYCTSLIHQVLATLHIVLFYAGGTNKARSEIIINQFPHKRKKSTLWRARTPFAVTFVVRGDYQCKC